MIRFVAFGLFGLMCIAYGRDPDGTAGTIHETFALGGTLVNEATNGVSSATNGGGGAAGSDLSVPDGWTVQVLPDGRRVAMPPGYTIAP